MQQIRRMWVNQPAKSQPYHWLHGTLVVAIDEEELPLQCLCYPTRGATISVYISKTALSEGWPEHLR